MPLFRGDCRRPAFAAAPASYNIVAGWPWRCAAVRIAPNPSIIRVMVIGFFPFAYRHNAAAASRFQHSGRCRFLIHSKAHIGQTAQTFNHFSSDTALLRLNGVVLIPIPPSAATRLWQLTCLNTDKTSFIGSLLSPPCCYFAWHFAVTGVPIVLPMLVDDDVTTTDWPRPRFSHAASGA